MHILNLKINFKKAIVRTLINVLIAFICFIIQTSIFPLLNIFSSSPNLLLILTFSYGLLYGEYAGLFTGLICGLLYDMYLDGIFGVYILIYTLLGYFNGLLYELFAGDTLSTPIILSIINSLIYNFYIYVVHFLIKGKLDIMNYFFSVIVPNIIFTLLFTILLYRLLFYLRHITKKI